MAEFKAFLHLSHKEATLLLCEHVLKKFREVETRKFPENPVPQVAQYLSAFAEENGISREDLSLSITIPPGRFTYRCFSLPPLKGRKLEEVVKFEFIRQIPFNEEDVEIKFVPVYRKEGVIVHSFLLLKRFINEIVSPFLEHGIYIESIVPEPWALLHLFPSRPFIVLEVTGNGSSVLINGEKGFSLFTFPERDGVSFALRSYRSVFGEVPDEAFIYGEVEDPLYLAEILGVKFLFPVLPDYISLTRPLDSKEWMEYAPLIGLAGILAEELERPEFSRREFMPPSKTRSAKSLHISTGIIFLSFLSIYTLSSLLHFTHYRGEYRRISSAITQIFKSTFPDVETIVDPVTQMKEKLTLLRAQGKRGEGKVIDFVKNVAQDATSVGNVKILELIWESGKARLKGQTQSISSIDTFEKKLREKKFSDVRLTRTQKSLREELYEFEIAVEF